MNSKNGSYRVWAFGLLACMLMPRSGLAYQCARGQEWYFDLWVLGSGDTFGAVGRSIRLTGVGGDCKHSFELPADEITLETARSPEGPWTPVAVLKRTRHGLIWTPQDAGLIFLRARWTRNSGFGQTPGPKAVIKPFAIHGSGDGAVKLTVQRTGRGNRPLMFLSRRDGQPALVFSPVPGTRRLIFWLPSGTWLLCKDVFNLPRRSDDRPPIKANQIHARCQEAEELNLSPDTPAPILRLK